ncbi:MAG: 16S rRNA (uracil(1498)-N(3))-methyltransferase [Kiritimatiellia bacterium]|nr:16S rRNA (uracil(1498)-N(3))-methyltransferase [Lentisphaerota bacterium]
MKTHALPRCFIDPASWRGTEVVLGEEESHHLLKVLRMRTADELTLFDGCGRSALARIAATGRQARLQVTAATIRHSPPPAVRIILIQAVPARQLMDQIVEKAVELGAAGVIPVVTERVTARGGEAAAARHARWTKIIRAAARQCGADWLPELTPVMALEGVLPRIRACPLCLVGSLAPEAAPLREVVSAIPGRPAEVMLVIGPEGDLSPSETNCLQEAGASLVSFGAGVMRVETAALYGLSLMRYEFLV